ncbi:hypothetical protein JD969_10185 [Planctomycetota bacterium]|nr:hypothetical protein JD969_10185 [Planctomycetota bacterium]
MTWIMMSNELECGVMGLKRNISGRGFDVASTNNVLNNKIHCYTKHCYYANHHFEDKAEYSSLNFDHLSWTISFADSRCRDTSIAFDDIYSTSARRLQLCMVLDELWQLMEEWLLFGRRIEIGEMLWHGPRWLRSGFADVYDWDVFGDVLMDGKESARRRLAVYQVLEGGSHEYIYLRFGTGREICCGKVVAMLLRERLHQGQVSEVKRVIGFIWRVSEKDSAALIELLKEG